MSGRTAVSYAGGPPMWVVVTAFEDHVEVHARRGLRTQDFPGGCFPVAGVLADVAGVMRVLGLDRLPAVLPWPEAVSRLADVRLDPVLLRFGLRLRPHRDRRLVAGRWAQALAAVETNERGAA